MNTLFITYVSSICSNLQITSSIFTVFSAFVLLAGLCPEYRKQLVKIFIISLILTIFLPANLQNDYLKQTMQSCNQLRTEKLKLEQQLYDMKLDCKLKEFKSENY